MCDAKYYLICFLRKIFGRFDGCTDVDSYAVALVGNLYYGKTTFKDCLVRQTHPHYPATEELAFNAVSDGIVLFLYAAEGII